MKKLVLTMLLIVSPLGLAGTAAPTDDIAQRVKACAACHGDQGRATHDGFYPRIAGKPAGYLFNQLLNFRDGRRVQPEMNYLVDRQDDAYLREMSAWFAERSPPYPPPQASPVDPSVLARGAALVRDGDPANQVPACRACHGERLTGVAPAIPGLLGLPYDYIAAQLGSWREGIRHAQTPDCMGSIARRLSAEDLAAASAWLSSQPMPEDPHPATSLPAPLPVECGGLPGTTAITGAAP